MDKKDERIQEEHLSYQIHCRCCLLYTSWVCNPGISFPFWLLLHETMRTIFSEEQFRVSFGLFNVDRDRQITYITLERKHGPI
jgi:hypothetical protein